MRKLYEIFNLLLIQKRIVAAATKLGNTVIKVIQMTSDKCTLTTFQKILTS